MAHEVAAQAAIERIIGTAMAALGAVLVVAEVLILFWGVTTRYVLDSPSLWTDETAIILFTWLAMIGAVLGFMRKRGNDPGKMVALLAAACATRRSRRASVLINDVHYAIVVILAMGIGLFAPPFGLGFYSACAIGRVSPEQTMRHIWPLLAMLVIALVIIAAFPIISTIMTQVPVFRQELTGVEV